MKKQIVVAVLLLIGYVFISYQGTQEDISIYKSDQKVVEVKGEITNAGVYEVAWDASLEEIIEAAGGIREQGTVDALNLSEIPAHQSVIVIPKRQEEVCISLNSATIEEFDTLPRSGSENRTTYS